MKDIIPDHTFDGGDLDCGSGLILLIRENMLKVAVGGILEMRSREPSVEKDLPPWCRMSGHEYLGKIDGNGSVRHFVRKGGRAGQEEALKQDMMDAKKYEWRLRSRATGHLKSTVYARNFSFDIGQPVSFEQKDANPCALEFLFGALASSLTTGFATECARDGLEVDDIEVSLSGTLNNILVHMGLEDGDASVQAIILKCFASSFDDGAKVTAAWQRTIVRSPIVATLKKCVELQMQLVIV